MIPSTSPLKKTSTECTDAQIVERVIEGERDAFTLIVSRHQNSIFAYLYQMVPHREAAEDLMQETFLQAFSKLEQWRQDSPLRGWLIRIARNQALTFFRKQTSRKKGTESSLDDDSVPLFKTLKSEQPLPSDSLAIVEHQQILASAIAQLPMDKREIVTLYYQEEFSLAKIAEITEKTPAATKVALHRIRLELKDIVARMTGEKKS